MIHGTDNDGRELIQSMCNVCRTSATRYTPGTAEVGTGEPVEDGADGWKGDRCMTLLKCANCRERTLHAFLRNGPQRDFLEREQLAQVEAQARLLDEQRLLEAVGVDVLYRVDTASIEEYIDPAWVKAGLLVQYLDTARHLLLLDSTASPKQQARAIDYTWRVLASGDYDGWTTYASDPDDRTDPPLRLVPILVRAEW